MSDTTFFVEACEGKTFPLHRDDYNHPIAEEQFLLRHGDPAVEVRNSTMVRRGIRDGDLCVVERKLEAAVEAAPAAEVPTSAALTPRASTMAKYPAASAATDTSDETKR